ncbi:MULTISPECIES: 4-hydroxy-tetrahydrodipicolinate synthase [Eubacterium]|uniref:4-hydroxy-tetrahydrodipicolinate synthase n=1 Tax=Eubacterium album TaxID=2978477 RepID=A0ABT2LWJ3_9FIRM|nr:MULTISPECIES: 4-hydroxy-tetrahydrodipicolinate synthase [unclassified Eubacterium (in: firmicutes)]MCT7397639.1 4-hydroxy-tetrahydrodipicolinate synthase [Eubacterium sp. LFL-14]RGG62168.1 4-hydroxy-tetrahydrodipicolinate synthase [Eubacterium sp. AF17-7]RHR34186.1 4-hydroxy-tetrahydrodipicolinate synthase [Eubacterium sp. AF19-12LB]
MSIFTGAGVAIITPMNEDGSINYDELGRIIENQIAGGTDAIIICGTTGESSTMNDEEHIKCIKYAVDKTAKRIPVIAGTGSNCTREAVNLAKQAQEVGADGLLCVTPYYNKATQGGLYQYYKDISDAVNIPIIMYNVPSRTGTNILPETAVKIAKEVKNVVAIKEASGNISQVAKLASLADGCLDIYSGNDDQVLPLLSLGGKGVISVWSNVAPAKVHDMVASYMDGDIEKAQKIQLEAIELIDALFCEVNPIPVKAAMNMLGYKAGSLRAPLTEMTDANKERLRKAMENYGIL